MHPAEKHILRLALNHLGLEDGGWSTTDVFINAEDEPVWQYERKLAQTVQLITATSTREPGPWKFELVVKERRPFHPTRLDERD